MYLLSGMGPKRFHLSLLLVVLLSAAQSGCKTGNPSAQISQKRGATQLARKGQKDQNQEGKQEKTKEATFTILPDPFAPALSAEQQAYAEWGRSTALARYSSALSLEMNLQGEAAFEEYVRAVNADPGNEVLLVNVCRQLIETGRLEDALTLLELSCKRKDASSVVYSWWALASVSNGDVQSGIKIAKQALQKPDAGALSYQTLFGIYAETENHKEALKILQQAEKVGQDSIPFLLDFSHLYLGHPDKIEELGLDSSEELARIIGRIEELMAQAEMEGSVRPDYSEKLADIYSALGKNEKALEGFEKLLQEYPGVLRLKEKRASTLFALQRYEEAEVEYRLLLRENPTNLQYVPILGDICQQLGRYKEAGDFYYYAAVMERNNPGLYLLAAGMRLAEGSPQKALDALELVRLSGYRTFRSEYLFGLAYGDLERYTEAIQSFKDAEELDKAEGSGNLGENFYLILVELYERSGEKEKAFEIAEELLKQYPDSPQSLNTLGYLWADNGMYLEKSLEMIRRAVEAKPNIPAFLDSLAWVLYKMNRPEQALAYQLQALELVDPGEHDSLIVYYDHLGDIYEAVGRKEEARTAWSRALETSKQIPYKKWLQSFAEKIKEKLEN